MPKFGKRKRRVIKDKVRPTDFEKFMVTKGDRWRGVGVRGGLGVWDGNVLKLGCDDVVQL